MALLGGGEEEGSKGRRKRQVGWEGGKASFDPF